MLPASSFEPEEAEEGDRSYPDFDLGAPARSAASQTARLEQLAAALPGRVWLGAAMSYGRAMRADLIKRRKLAERLDLPLLATNDVLMHDPARRELGDVLTCIRIGATLETAGRRLPPNAEHHLKPPAEMRRLFAEAPDAVAETLRFLAGISFSLDELSGDYPEELRAVCRDTLAEARRLGVTVPRLEEAEPLFNA